MRILLSKLPSLPWWGKGMPVYQNNWMMEQGRIPRQTVITKTHRKFINTIRDFVEIVIMPFPKHLDADYLYKHDFIFVRDSFISDQHGGAIISNFTEIGRQDEAIEMKKILRRLDIKTHILPDYAHAEGGEFYYLPQQRILFAGMRRNNKKGIEAVASLLDVVDVCIIETDSYHLDTNFTVIFDVDAICRIVLGCREKIKNYRHVTEFCRSYGISFGDLDAVDGLGDPLSPGHMAVNCLSLPGVLIGPATFATGGVKNLLKKHSVNHVVVPLRDLLLTAGGIHCLTNELF